MGRRGVSCFPSELTTPGPIQLLPNRFRLAAFGPFRPLFHSGISESSTVGARRCFLSAIPYLACCARDEQEYFVIYLCGPFRGMWRTCALNLRLGLGYRFRVSSASLELPGQLDAGRGRAQKQKQSSPCDHIEANGTPECCSPNRSTSSHLQWHVCPCFLLLAFGSSSGYASGAVAQVCLQIYAERRLGLSRLPSANKNPETHSYTGSQGSPQPRTARHSLPWLWNRSESQRRGFHMVRRIMRAPRFSPIFN